jgi:hypothetical protein
VAEQLVAARSCSVMSPLHPSGAVLTPHGGSHTKMSNKIETFHLPSIPYFAAPK